MNNERKQVILEKLAKAPSSTKAMSEGKAREVLTPVEPLGPADPTRGETRLAKREGRVALQSAGAPKDYVTRALKDKDLMASQVAIARKAKAQAQGRGGYHDPQFQESTPIGKTKDLGGESTRRVILAKLKKRHGSYGNVRP